MEYELAPASGQKTGFFLDQRNNRLRVKHLARGRDVLDCFCYTGGFSLSALAGGARSVLSVESSAQALAQAKRNLGFNPVPPRREEGLQTHAVPGPPRPPRGRPRVPLLPPAPPQISPAA